MVQDSLFMVHDFSNPNLVRIVLTMDVSIFNILDKSKCDFLVLSGDKWREKNFLLSDKSA